VIEHKGTIDKYMGDAIMAFWNAPLDDPDHATNACHSALAMLRALERLNDERLDEAKAGGLIFRPLAAGLGINTGECVIGNLGSDLRFDYSVLGDPVNIASRLEGQTKVYGVQVLIGETTAKAVVGHFAMLEVDRVRVIGKQEPERIFALLGDKSMLFDKSFQLLDAGFSAALEAYRSQSWPLAAELLKSCRFAAEQTGVPRLIETFESRIEGFMLEGAPADWDGVFRASKK